MKDAEIAKAVGRGMAIAAAIMAKRGEDTFAREILDAAGYGSLSEIKKDGLADFDLRHLRHIMRGSV